MFKIIQKSNVAALRRICILGVGDGGSRAVEAVQGDTSSDTTLAVMNTDPSGLEQSGVATRLQIGGRSEAQKGTGGDPGVGRLAAEDDLEMLRGLMSDCDALILVVCLGGGMGTGAGPVALSTARAAGILSVCI